MVECTRALSRFRWQVCEDWRVGFESRLAFDQTDWQTNVPLRPPHVIAEDSASGSPFVDVTVLHNFGRSAFRIHYTIFN